MNKNQMYLKPNPLVNADGKISRKEKLDLFNAAQPPYIFLAHTVSLLVRSCLFVKSQNKKFSASSAFAVGQYQGLDKTEYDLIVNEMHNRQWLIGKSAESRVFKNSLATMYAHISYNNREFGKIYIEYMFNLISNNDY